VLLVERMARDGSQFLNAHVFPGGQTDDVDNGNVKSAALRELYEEANIHLESGLPSQIPPRIILHLADTDSKEVPYSEYIRTRRIQPAESNLIPYARWITPTFMRKRFDTYFFLALASPGQIVDGKVDGQEIKSLSWLRPSEALNIFDDGKIILFPPQWYLHPFVSCSDRRYILTDLKNTFPTLSSLLRFYASGPELPLPMAPQVLNVSKTGFTMVLPGDEAYKPEVLDKAESIPGSRHRLIIQSEEGKPRKYYLERKLSKGGGAKL